MVGKVDAVHHAVERFASIDAIPLLDVLAHERGLSHTARTAYGYQLTVPRNRVHHLANDIKTRLRYQYPMFVVKRLHIL